MNILNWDHPSIKKEIEIRGRYAMLSCDLEYCLLNIIIFCNPEPFNHERFGQFKKMQMSSKIDCAIADIKKYRFEYYIEFKEYFDGLEEFRIVRNDMAHGKGDFPCEPDLSVYRILSIREDENGNERLAFKEYTDDYIYSSIGKFSKVNAYLSSLWLRLSKEQRGTIHPLAYPNSF